MDDEAAAVVSPNCADPVGAEALARTRHGDHETGEVVKEEKKTEPFGGRTCVISKALTNCVNMHSLRDGKVGGDETASRVSPTLGSFIFYVVSSLNVL